MENYERAEQDYMTGMKYAEIAEKYGTTVNTVKSWKQRYKWDRKKGAHQNEKGCTQKKSARAPMTPIDDGTKETLENDELSPEHQLFCIYYIRTFNATQSYINAFQCSYDTAKAQGYKLLQNIAIKAEINRLKEIKRQQIVAGADDIVELQMRIAFSDMGNYVTFGKKEIEYKGDLIEVNTVDLADAKQTDTQLIRKVKQGKDGISIEVEDRQKAIDWLTKYFLMHPDDKYKAEFDRKRAEVDDNNGVQILENMQTIVDILQYPTSNRCIEDFEEEQTDE